MATLYYRHAVAEVGTAFYRALFAANPKLEVITARISDRRSVEVLSAFPEPNRTVRWGLQKIQALENHRAARAVISAAGLALFDCAVPAPGAFAGEMKVHPGDAGRMSGRLQNQNKACREKKSKLYHSDGPPLPMLH